MYRKSRLWKYYVRYQKILADYRKQKAKDKENSRGCGTRLRIQGCAVTGMALFCGGYVRKVSGKPGTLLVASS